MSHGKVIVAAFSCAVFVMSESPAVLYQDLADHVLFRRVSSLFAGRATLLTVSIRSGTYEMESTVCLESRTLVVLLLIP